jgi:hypothetical protein
LTRELETLGSLGVDDALDDATPRHSRGYPAKGKITHQNWQNDRTRTGGLRAWLDLEFKIKT